MPGPFPALPIFLGKKPWERGWTSTGFEPMSVAPVSRGHGFKPVEVLNFSGLDIRSCINCVRNCEDHSLLGYEYYALFLKPPLLLFSNFSKVSSSTLTIPMQRGCSPLQVPSFWQVRVAEPTNRKPELQVYETTELWEFAAVLFVPSLTSPGSIHVSTKLEILK